MVGKVQYIQHDHDSRICLTLNQSGSEKSINYRGPFCLTSLSRGVNSPPPVSGRCVLERYGFGNPPRTVRKYYCTWKEQETGPTGNPPPAIYAARDENLIGMLTEAAPHCGPRPGRTSPTLGWSVITVKQVGSMKVGRVEP